MQSREDMVYQIGDAIMIMTTITIIPALAEDSPLCPVLVSLFDPVCPSEVPPTQQ